MTVVAFTVAGTPVPQGSMRAVPTGRGARVTASNASALGSWRGAVAAAARDAMQGRPAFPGPVRLELVCDFARPRAHFGTGRNRGRLKPSAPVYRAGRPDLDKLVRAVCDALTGIVIRDDDLVVELFAAKHFGEAAAHITVSELG